LKGSVVQFITPYEMTVIYCLM